MTVGYMGDVANATAVESAAQLHSTQHRGLSQ